MKTFTQIAQEVADEAAKLPQIGFREIPEELSEIFDRRNLVDTAARAVALIAILDKQASE